MPFVHTGGGVLPTPAPSIYPLVVSGRWVNTALGTPFYLNGDAAWSLPVNIPTSEVQLYMADRVAKGVNAILLSMIEHKFTDQTPAWVNRLGDNPFTSTISANNPDFTTPNEAYWSHVDYVIQMAGLYGLTVLAAPCYLGFDETNGDEGWSTVVVANGTTRMTTYGSFLGNRYKTFPNIIWVMGGDAVPNSPTDLTTHVNNLANAIKTADTVHLMTAHPAPGSMSMTSYNQSWLDINVAYPTDNADLTTRVRAAYQQASAKPIFMIEGQYGNEHSMTDILLRIQMYQSVLGGGLGHIYGQDPTWYFGNNAGTSANSTGFANTTGVDWRNVMSNFGANFLTYVQRLQAARPLNTLTPDYSHTRVTSGFGTDGVTYAPAVYSSNILAAYTNGVALTVDKSQFTSATFNLNWYNVRDGSTTAGTAVSMGSGSQAFTPPTTGGGNDWVLLLDNQSLNLSNPVAQGMLTVAADGRSILRPDGSKLQINGDTAWSLAVNLNDADTITYLNDRQAKGVNLIVVNLIEHKFSEQTPKWRNKNGDDPFTSTVSAGNPDFTTPNEPYWAHVDWIVDQAKARGMYVLAFPCYIGYQPDGVGDEGWGSVVSANGTTRMTTYGNFLGNRYKNKPNIIWAIGGDNDPVNTVSGVGDLTVHYNNLANGIKANASHLMTAHGNGESISSTSYNQTWLDLNFAYTKSAVSTYSRNAYQATPAKPSILIEGMYGNSSYSDADLRSEMYQSTLGGCVGHIYGQYPIWYFGIDSSASGNSFPGNNGGTGGLDWRTQLSTFGAAYLVYVSRLLAARNLSLLVPDYAHTKVTSGYGVDGLNYAPVAASSNILVAYTRGVALTVAKSQFTSATFNVNWYNPRDGSTTSGGTVAMGSGSQVFTPPTTGSSNDWVLLLDNQSLGLGNP
jgi:hypothetical protein